MFVKLENTPKLIGSQCVLDSISKGLPLPENKYPICNRALESLNICVCPSIEERKASLYKMIIMMNGKIESTTSNSTQLVISELGSSKETRKAGKMGIPVVLPTWLSSCWDAGSKIEMESHFVSALKGSVVSLTGFTQSARKVMGSLITDLGGSYSPDLTKKCTHLIAEQRTGMKYRYALLWGIKIVNSNWLFETINYNYCLNEMDFLIDDRKVGFPGITNKTMEAEGKLQKKILTKLPFLPKSLKKKSDPSSKLTKNLPLNNNHKNAKMNNNLGSINDVFISPNQNSINSPSITFNLPSNNNKIYTSNKNYLLERLISMQQQKRINQNSSQNASKKNESSPSNLAEKKTEENSMQSALNNKNNVKNSKNYGTNSPLSFLLPNLNNIDYLDPSTHFNSQLNSFSPQKKSANDSFLNDSSKSEQIDDNQQLSSEEQDINHKEDSNGEQKNSNQDLESIKQLQINQSTEKDNLNLHDNQNIEEKLDLVENNTENQSCNLFIDMQQSDLSNFNDFSNIFPPLFIPGSNPSLHPRLSPSLSTNFLSFPLSDLSHDERSHHSLQKPSKKSKMSIDILLGLKNDKNRNPFLFFYYLFFIICFLFYFIFILFFYFIFIS